MIMLLVIFITMVMVSWMMWMIQSLTEKNDEGSIMSRCDYSELADKQAYVKANLDKFGCKDNGTSMDDREIYVVSPEAMGLQPKSDWDKPFVAVEE